MSVTEVSYEGPISRVMNSLKGVVVGLLFVVAAPVGLWFNEKNAVETAAALTEGAGKVVTVPNKPKDPSTSPKLVHTTGKAETKETLKDPDFGLSVTAIRLEREVEMYQWKEEKHTKTSDTVGGSKKTETTYTYKLVWDDDEINSSAFKDKDPKYRNPPMALKGMKFYATDVTLGDYKLSRSLISMISNETHLPVTEAMTATFPDELRAQYKAANGILQSGNPSSPKVGDLKVKFTVVNNQDVSLVSSLNNGEFSPWKASNGKEIELLECGTHDAAAMFEHAQSMNAMMTWIFRFVGFIVMWIGVSLIVSPLEEFARAIPLFGMLLGGAVGFGVGLFAFVVSVFATGVIIAIAWFAARPMLSIGLMVAVLGITFAMRGMFGKKKVA